MNNSTSSNRGFASMDPERRKKVAREGGKASGGKFEKGSLRASEAGIKGAAAQPTESKRLGGMNSHVRSNHDDSSDEVS